MTRTILNNIFTALPDRIPDPLPPSLSTGRGLMRRGRALKEAHVPPEGALLYEYQARPSEAHRRFIFEEFFLLQLALGLRRAGQEDARREAQAILSEIREEKERGATRHGPLLDHMKRQWGARIGMMDVG